jgi:16S rRNA (guanine527-N7)-methyltransferase
LTFDLVRAPLERATAALPPLAQRGLAAWLELLCAWNARIDLTAARTPDELVDLMLADALVLAKRIAAGARVVDVGAGAGAPGLALALARPDLAVTLCEPLAKRTSFLRTALGTVGRADVTIARARGEELRGAWDVAVSRATLAPAAWLALGARLAPRGSVWVLLAKEAPPILEGSEVVEDVAYEWPGTRAARRAVRFAGRATTA